MDEAVADPRTAPSEDGGAPRGGGLKANRLGVVFIVFFVVAAAAPLVGVAGSIPGQIVLGNGAGVPGTNLVAGLILLLFSVGYIALTSKVTNAGAFFAYIARGLGIPPGVGSAFISTVAYFAVQMAVYAFFGVVVSAKAAEITGNSTPWWVWTLVAWVLTLLLSLLQVDVGARILGALMLLEVVALAIVTVAVLIQGGGPEGISVWDSLNPSVVFAGGLGGSAGIALAFAFASFIGFEATAIYGEETRNPKRSVPRATYAAVIAISLMFALTSFALISAMGSSSIVEQTVQVSTVDNIPLSDPTALLYAVTDDYVGHWLVEVMSWLILSSVFASIVALQNSAARYLFAMGRARVLPQVLQRTNGRGAPAVAGTAVSLASLVVILLFAVSESDPVVDMFYPFGGLAVISILLVEILVSISVIVVFRKEPAGARVWNTLVAPALSAVLLAGALYLLVSRFGILAGTVPEGVDPTKTAMVLSAKGWALVLLPFVLLVVGGLVGWLRSRSENSSAVADFVA